MLTIGCGQPATENRAEPPDNASSSTTTQTSPTSDTLAPPPLQTPGAETSSSAAPAVTHAAERPVKRGDKLTTEQLTLLAGKPGVVKLTWRTESEQSNFGFNVMRSAIKDGPFEPVNELVILGAGDSSTPNIYEFFDTNVKVGEVFFYQVESISMQGQQEPFTPVLTITVNREFLGYEDEPSTGTQTTTPSMPAQ